MVRDFLVIFTWFCLAGFGFSQRPTLFRTYKFNSAQQDMIIREHNRLRALEPASNMQKMVWDSNLASLALQYVSTCNSDHSRSSYRRGNGFHYIGENIWWSSEPWLRSDLASPIRDFYNEKPFYHFRSKSCRPGQMCGHYTQVVWAKSCAVGCAAAHCDNIIAGGRIPKGHIIICHYGPGGNSRREFPYRMGSPCASCRDSCTTDGLCPSICSGVNFPPIPKPPKNIAPRPDLSRQFRNFDRFNNRVQDRRRGKDEKFVNSLRGISSSCVDTNTLCAFWAKEGECDRNQQWMKQFCFFSCSPQRCGVSKGVVVMSDADCVDADWRCRYWAGIGECTKGQDYMKWKCPRVCGFC